MAIDLEALEKAADELIRSTPAMPVNTQEVCIRDLYKTAKKLRTQVRQRRQDGAPLPMTWGSIADFLLEKQPQIPFTRASLKTRLSAMWAAERRKETGKPKPRHPRKHRKPEDTTPALPDRHVA